MNDKELQETVEVFLQENSHTDLARFARRVKPELRVLFATILVSEFRGEAFYVPNNSSMERCASVIRIKGALEGIEPGTQDFKNKVRQLGKVLDMPMYQVKRILRAGKYVR